MLKSLPIAVVVEELVGVVEENALGIGLRQRLLFAPDAALIA